MKSFRGFEGKDGRGERRFGKKERGLSSEEGVTSREVNSRDIASVVSREE